MVKSTSSSSLGTYHAFGFQLATTWAFSGIQSASSPHTKRRHCWCCDTMCGTAASLENNCVKHKIISKTSLWSNSPHTLSLSHTHTQTQSATVWYGCRTNCFLYCQKRRCGASFRKGAMDLLLTFGTAHRAAMWRYGWASKHTARRTRWASGCVKKGALKEPRFKTLLVHKSCLFTSLRYISSFVPVER